MSIFNLFLSQSCYTIKFLEAAGFRATERFCLAGFLRLSFRICHLQKWHSVTAYFFASPFLWRGKKSAGTLFENSKQSIHFSYFSWKQTTAFLPYLLKYWHSPNDVPFIIYMNVWFDIIVWCGLYIWGRWWIYWYGLPWRSLCFKTWAHAKSLGWGLTYALIFYYRLMSRPVVPLIKPNMADTSS